MPAHLDPQGEVLSTDGRVRLQDNGDTVCKSGLASHVTVSRGPHTASGPEQVSKNWQSPFHEVALSLTTSLKR